jgi:hypothetical protein
MKKNSKSNLSFIFLNILLAIIIIVFLFNFSKISKIDLILEKVTKIEKKLDEELVPGTRIKRKKNKKKKKDWKD